MTEAKDYYFLFVLLFIYFLFSHNTDNNTKLMSK